MNRSAAHSKLIRACLELLGFHRIPAWSSKTTGQYDPTTGRWRKAKGVKARKGVADITGVIPPHGRALFVECKTGSGSLSPAQRDFRDEVVGAGALWVLARSLDDVQDTLDLLRATGCP